MRWEDVRKVYPQQWLVIEALEAYTHDQRRVLERIAVVEVCLNGDAAFQSYRRLHKEHPEREFYFVSTDREELDIRERMWLGVRPGYEYPAPSGLSFYW